MRKWSWKIGRLLGIDTEVHASFLLLLGWVAFGTLYDGGTWALVAYSVVFLLGVFASVVLHELGHALTARLYGVRTRRILLLPIGGMAQLEGMPRNPRAEMTIALAGPAVSLALAAGLALITTVLGQLASPLLLTTFLGSLMWANLMIAVFNLIPAFPMDGGRALRAWLARRHDYLQATEKAVSVAKIAALAVGVFGLLFNPLLVLIAVFVWFAGSAELRATRMQARASHSRPHPLEVWSFRPRGPGDDRPRVTVLDPQRAHSDDDFDPRGDPRLHGGMPQGIFFWRIPRR